MKAFLVELQNQPGGLARLAEALAERGINITAIGGAASSGGSSTIGLMTNDEPGARSALEGAGFSVRLIDIVGITLPNQPGTLAGAARRLANAGINIELLLATGIQGADVSVAIGVDDIEAAREALGELASSPA